MKADEAVKPQGRLSEVVESTSRASRWRGARETRWAGWLFVLPALIVYAAFVLLPLAMTVFYSTQRWNGIGPSTFVGVDNYVRTVTDPNLFVTIVNAFKLIFFFSVVPVTLGLLVASLIRRVATGRLGSASRTVLFLPQIIPLVAAGITWSWLLSKNGLINQILDAIGLGGVTRAWLADFGLALPAVGRHRRMGPAWTVHHPAAHGHEQDRPVTL